MSTLINRLLGAVNKIIVVGLDHVLIVGRSVVRSYLADSILGAVFPPRSAAYIPLVGWIHLDIWCVPKLTELDSFPSAVSSDVKVTHVREGSTTL